MTEPTTPLHIPDYRRFWAARFTSVLATNGMVVIIGYQLYDVARQTYGMTIPQASFLLGMLGLAQFVPMFLLTPIAGVVADRFDRRHVGACAMGIDLIVALMLALATGGGWLNLPLLFSLGVAHGTARVFVGPAVGSIAPVIVPAAILPRAVALNSLAMQTGMIGGPALAGILFGIHAPLPYAVSTALLVVGIMALLSIRPLPPVAANKDVHPLRQVADGFSYVRGHPFLLGCITLDLFAVLLAGATALLPIYARDFLTWNGMSVGASGLGQMRAAPALGAAVFGLILAFYPLQRRVGYVMLGAVAAFGAATIGFGLSAWVPGNGGYLLALASLVALGAFDMISVFVRGSLIQLHTPDEMRGRVSAISGLAISASNELGEMESGFAASLLGPIWAVVLGGIGAIVITCLWGWLFPDIRRAYSFAREETPHKGDT
ncbi:MFS transporter [Novosphingobium sp. FSY-8]|uniref:Multidrug efflux pump Tap n=1 Tax=Novosphingobium ovatum TaxID=1908523 RepID=A0ABW9XCN7_9SPHN|nr:MFS transporter [Novosphingobium ovatum]NBC36298.1 MFS transporter [Novosphingobium ovatum]